MRTLSGSGGWSRLGTTGAVAILALATVLGSTGSVAAGGAAALLSIEGRVTDRGGSPVGGAAVAVDGAVVTTTDAGGRFSVEVAAGVRAIRVTHPAYQTRELEIRVDDDLTGLAIELAPPMSVSETITVTAIRAGEEVPVTTRDLDRASIEELDAGQDPPALLQYTPSVTWYSDSGGASNYSYLSLRGIQQTRINMTFDGAPLNDPAEHALYFNNFGDFLADVDSIQVQRGVGTTSVGSPSFGGSVNFASVPLSQTSRTEARLAFGSYATRRASVAYQTGEFGDGFAVAGRVSWSDTDGYREHSGSEHLTLFLDAGWQGERSSLRLVSFSGDERSQLAYLAVDPDTLRHDPRFNPMAPEERDHFGQDFAQLQYTRALGATTVLVASLYYNGAAGWFDLWDDPVAKNELMRFGIDQSFVGSMVSLSSRSDRVSTTFGIHYNDFRGVHTLDVSDQRLYRNTGLKQTANAFAKAEYRLGDWLLYGDLGLRWAEFGYRGDLDLGAVHWTFLDPKMGLRRFLSERLSAYASLGQAGREPARLDLLAGEDNATVVHDLEAVKPEHVTDLEVGVNLDTPRVALRADAYAMEFRDEIALTGELSDVGLPLRRNVDRSYRRGIEVDLRWLVGGRWTLIHSSNLSRNRIRDWTQYYDVYDASGTWVDSVPLVHHDVPPLLTPELIVNQGVAWARRNLELTLMGRYVAASHLDNTGSDELVAPSYYDVDLRGSVVLGRWRPAGRPRLTLYLNNLLDDRRQFPSGYSYPYIDRDASGRDVITGIPYYYPLAGVNFAVTLDFSL